MMKLVAVVVVDHFAHPVDRCPGPGDSGSTRAHGLSVGVLDGLTKYVDMYNVN